MATGFILLHRQLLDNPMWTSEQFTRSQAWIDLLLLANHADSHIYVRGIRVEVKRGDVGRSELFLSKRWGWSRKKVHGFLDGLEKEQQIAQQKSKVYTVISVLNYDKYQSGEQQKEQQKSIKRTSKEHQRVQHTNNDETMINNDKQEIHNTSSPAAPGFDFSEQNFETFWSEYPRKKEKAKARAAFFKLKPEPPLFVAIMDSLRRHISVEWAKTEPQFIPHPTTWLNGRRWEDEVAAHPTKPPTVTDDERGEQSLVWCFHNRPDMLLKEDRERIAKKLGVAS